MPHVPLRDEDDPDNWDESEWTKRVTAASEIHGIEPDVLVQFVNANDFTITEDGHLIAVSERAVELAEMMTELHDIQENPPSD